MLFTHRTGSFLAVMGLISILLDLVKLFSQTVVYPPFKIIMASVRYKLFPVFSGVLEVTSPALNWWMMGPLKEIAPRKCYVKVLLRGLISKRAKGHCPSERISRSWYILREWNSKRLVIQHEVFWLFLYLLCFSQEVVYNNTFYAPSVVLVSVHHQYNRLNKKNEFHRKIT